MKAVLAQLGREAGKFDMPVFKPLPETMPTDVDPGTFSLSSGAAWI